jgi:aminoglycoside 6'-N-acetyltransferase I
MDGIRIAPLDPADEAAVERAAALLVESFAEHHPRAWPDIEAARGELRECLEPEKVALGAFDAEGTLVGWIGGQPAYSGDIWELHPMVVDERFRGRGIGRMMVEALEDAVRERGALTLYLGTDDENEQTTVGGVEVFPNLLDRLLAIRNLRGHPFEFYQRLGYELVGMLPHANGFGRPDILMAKRLIAPS